MTFCQDIYKTLCERHPESKIYVIGDQHFYHQNIINYTRTEFRNVDEMNRHIIDCHNGVIENTDIVMFLGDFCLKKPQIGEIVKALNGHKYLILGNHDPQVLERNYLALGFEGVYTTPVRIENSFISHEPLIKEERADLTFQHITNEFRNCIGGKNYHGHIHTKDDGISSTYINSTCEALEYKPLLIGKTKAASNQDKPLFINSSHFVTVINDLKRSCGIEPRLILDDYIYSTMLQTLSDYREQSFIQGSFGLYKKYGFISRFSDIDISYLYDPENSKKKNYALMNKIADEIYEQLKGIHGINLEFLKRYKSIRIVRASLLKPTNVFSDAHLDMNAIPLDCYRNSDFKVIQGISSTEKYLAKASQSLIEDYTLPHFQVQTLKPVGDISCLILQIMFQEGNIAKKTLALKKLLYVYKHVIKDEVLENFLDTFVRFFLRNIALLSLWNRTKEIEYIKENATRLCSLLKPFVKSIPKELKDQIYDVLTNPNSTFLQIYDELLHTPTEESLKKCAMILKQIK